MNSQEIEESNNLFKEFTSNICEEYNIEPNGDELEIRDYISEDDLLYKTEYDIDFLSKNIGMILYLMVFEISDSIFPIIRIDTVKRNIKFSISYDGGEDTFYHIMVDGISCLDNIKMIIPYFNMVLHKLIDYRLSISLCSSDEFRQSLLRDFSIKSVLE